MNAAAVTFQALQSPPKGVSPQAWLEHHCNSVWYGVEKVHFDFKEKHDTRDAALADSDKKNLAKAISGFANSGGGILVWGVADDGNLKPIDDANKFLNAILQLSFQVTEPSVAGIDGAFVPLDSDSNKGCVLLYIPNSDTYPHRVILSQKEVNGHYFIRSGSSFAKASHVHLEDMFGRKPLPKLKLNLTTTGQVVKQNDRDELQVSLLVELENTGRGMAKFPYVSISVSEPFYVSSYGYDGNGRSGLGVSFAENQVNFPASSEVKGYRTIEYGSSDGRVIHSGARLVLTKIMLEGITPDDLKDSSVEFKYAAEGVPLTSTETQLISASILRAVSKTDS